MPKKKAGPLFFEKRLKPSQYPIPLEACELCSRKAMLLLRLLQQLRELRPFPNRIEPRVAGQGGITAVSAFDHAFKEL